jgi:hypothetical protein
MNSPADPQGKNRTVSKTPAQKRMIAAVVSLTKYMVSYTKQGSYEDYLDTTFIDDVLYGLGIALGEKYSFAKGFDEFKQVLREHLK